MRRWASGELNRLNALIRRGIRTPKGERRLARRSGISDCNGFGESPTGISKKQAGNTNLEMGSLETDASLRASERSFQDIGPDREQRADGLRSVNPYLTGKPGMGSNVDNVQLS